MEYVEQERTKRHYCRRLRKVCGVVGGMVRRGRFCRKRGNLMPMEVADGLSCVYE